MSHPFHIEVFAEIDSTNVPKPEKTTEKLYSLKRQAKRRIRRLAAGEN